MVDRSPQGVQIDHSGIVGASSFKVDAGKVKTGNNSKHSTAIYFYYLNILFMNASVGSCKVEPVEVAL